MPEQLFPIINLETGVGHHKISPKQIEASG